MTSKLTLNYGLRYEYWSPWTVPRNTTLTFNFQTGQPSFALQNPNDFSGRQQVLRRLCAFDAGPTAPVLQDRGHNFAPGWA